MTKVFTIEFDFMGRVRQAVVTMAAEEKCFYYVKLLDMDLLSFMPQMVIFNKHLESQNIRWQYLNGSKESFLVQEVLKSMTGAIQEQVNFNNSHFKDLSN